MALNIRNKYAEQLAETLARLTGENKTQAVSIALKDRLDRVQSSRSSKSLADLLDDIALHCAKLPILDSRNPDEIIGYDDHGAPGS